MSRRYRILARVPVPIPRRATQKETDTDEFDASELTVSRSTEDTSFNQPTLPEPLEVSTDHLTKPKPASHEFRFRLRTILILTAVTCAIFAILAWIIRSIA